MDNLVLVVEDTRATDGINGEERLEIWRVKVGGLEGVEVTVGIAADCGLGTIMESLLWWLNDWAYPRASCNELKVEMVLQLELSDPETQRV